jgi:hypothetical protein
MSEKNLIKFLKSSIDNEHLYDKDELKYMKSKLKNLKKLMKKQKSFLNIGE